MSTGPIGSIASNRTFNRADRVVEGWYWVMAASELRRGQVKAVRLLGRDLAIFRGEDGKVVAADAYCPHMGAHLAEGKVDGNGIRCFFHNWKFDASGACVDVPCARSPVNASIRTWPIEERYGLVWIWTGDSPRQPIPFAPELEGHEVDYILGPKFAKNCHPNVVMINAIDAHHFNTVHHLPVDLEFDVEAKNENNITFSNRTRMPRGNLFTRFAARFYAGPLTYAMSYWFGSTGSVTVGPDFLHFYIIFALRMVDGGKTEGRTILVTRRRRGLFGLGRVVNGVLLFLSWVVGAYFARGDTRVFQTIRFDFKTPIKADASIIQFVKHVEGQRALEWGSWQQEDAGIVRLASVGLGARP